MKYYKKKKLIKFFIIHMYQKKMIYYLNIQINIKIFSNKVIKLINIIWIMLNIKYYNLKKINYMINSKYTIN